MEYWIIASSNYIFVLLLTCYVITAFAALWTRRLSAGFVVCQKISRYAFLITGNLTLFLVGKDIRILFFGVAQLVFFFVADLCQKRWYQKCSKTLFQNMMLLLSIGFLMLSRLSFEKALRQFLIASAALACSMLLPLLVKKIQQPERFRVLFAAGGIGLLALVLLNGISIFGAKNWLSIRGFVFQPSEFVKLLFLLAMAALLGKEPERSKAEASEGKRKMWARRLARLSLVSLIAMAHVLLLAATNDFGGALIFFFVYIAMIFVVGKSILFPTFACVVGGVAGLLVCRYSGHVADRILAWQDPFPYIEKEGYQMAQSLFAIGNGGWFGAGLGQGMPKTIPVVTSDFIFSAISEEFGAIFAALLLLVYVNIVLWLLLLAVSCKKPFYYALTVGAIALFGFQMFLNVGGVIKLIPSTGVTLAFISYGGSSVMATILMLQGLQAVGELSGEERNFCIKRHKRLAVAAGAGLLVVCGMVLYFLTVTVPQAKQSLDNEYNQRIKRQEQQMLRGKILSSDSFVLAQTILGEDGAMYRVYPFGEAAAFVTGRNTMGKSGLEKSENLTLLSVGISGLERFLQKANAKVPEGNSIVVTIDAELQQLAYQLLENKKGAIGVMEIATGKMLAMVSTPAYNPNELTELWENINDSTEAPLLNRLTQGLYPPGSTFKLMTTLAYLQKHDVDEFSHTCLGIESIQGISVRCYNAKAHGTQNLQEAFVHSCNTAYAALGSQIVCEDYQKTAQQLGFSEVWTNTIPYRADSFALSDDTKELIAVQTAFGQGETLITPFHNLMIAAAIANEGIVQLPYLVEQVQNFRGEILEERSSQGTQVLMTKEETALLTEYMTEASKRYMEEFAAKGITVSGKTGSAETGTGSAHAWYLCFAGKEQPEIAVCVLIEHAGLGSEQAVPVAKELLQKWFFQK